MLHTILPILAALAVLGIFYLGMLLGAAMTESNQKREAKAAAEPLMEVVSSD